MRPDNAVEPVHHQNRTKRGSRANCQRWEALVCIDHFQLFWKDYSHPWNANLDDFHPGTSGGHVDPRWKSPDVTVDCEFGWKSPHVVLSL